MRNKQCSKQRQTVASSDTAVVFVRSRFSLFVQGLCRVWGF